METPEPEVIEKAIKPEVTLSPSQSDVLKGSGQAFKAFLYGSDMTSLFDWSIVESGKNAGTTISGAGSLTVHASETLSRLTIKAALKTDSSISGTAAVTVHQTTATLPTVDSVTVTPAAKEFVRGSVYTQQFSAVVNGTNNPSQDVT